MHNCRYNRKHTTGSCTGGVNSVSDGGAKWALCNMANNDDLEDMRNAITEVVNTKSDVYITGGTIGNGGTIPLPSGYDRSQCKYAVWHNSIGLDMRNNGYGQDNKNLSVSVNQSTGVVSCVYSYRAETEAGSKPSYSNTGTAGYLVVAVK